jgi:hypothetical protein
MNWKIKITWTFSQVVKHRLAVQSMGLKPMGVFLWLGSGNTIDRVVGYHFKRGWIADYCYQTRNHWMKDLYFSLFKVKDGFVRITRWI